MARLSPHGQSPAPQGCPTPPRDAEGIGCKLAAEVAGQTAAHLLGARCALSMHLPAREVAARGGNTRAVWHARVNPPALGHGAHGTADLSPLAVCSRAPIRRSPHGVLSRASRLR